MKSDFLAARLSTLTEPALARFRRKFFQRPKVYLHGLTSTVEIAGPGKRVHWIVSRALLRHDVFTIPAGQSSAERRSMLALLIRRWAPFRETGHIAHWSNNQATVYAWDAPRIKSAIVEAGLDPAKCKILPESFARMPMHDGVRLVRAIDGFEGQVWRNGLLTASRWWNQEPSQNTWSALMRSAHITPLQQEFAKPEATDVEIQDEPWGLRTNPLEDAWLYVDTPRGRLTAACIATALPLFFAAEWAGASSERASLTLKREQLYVASEPVRAQRDKVLANLDAIDQLAALNPFPAQFSIMLRTFELLEGENVKIIDWTYGAGALEMSIQAQQNTLDATKFIAKFEGDDMFMNVSARTLQQPGTLRLRLELTKQADADA